MVSFDEDFNFIFLVLLLFSFLGSLWLAWNDVRAGYIYILMMLVTISSIVLVQLFVKDDKQLKKIKDYIRAPFAIDGRLAALLYLLGIASPFLLNLIAKAVSSFTVTSFSIPLFGNDIRQGVTQSFSAAAVESSMQWKIFTLGIAAGTAETFTFVFGAFLIGLIFSYTIVQLLTGADKPDPLAVRVGAALFAIATFIGSHALNQNYVGIAFLIAGVFMLANILTVYWFGVFLVYWAGYHTANNILWLMQAEGYGAVFQGFLTPIGGSLVVFLLLLAWYALSDSEKTAAAWRKYRRSA